MMEIAGINNIKLYENKGIAFVFPDIANIDEISNVNNSGTVDEIDFCKDINFSRKLAKGRNRKQLKNDTLEFFIQDFTIENQATVKRLQASRVGYIASIEFESGETLVLQMPLFFGKTKKAANKNSFVVSANYRVQSLLIDLSLVPIVVLLPPVGADVFYWYGIDGYGNINIFNDAGKHTLAQVDDYLELSRIASSGGMSQFRIHSDTLYTGGVGKNLYIKYEISELSTGTITNMQTKLYDDIFVSGTNNGKIEETTNLIVGGLRDRVSPTVTDISNTFYPSITILSSAALYKLKIYEIYYL